MEQMMDENKEEMEKKTKWLENMIIKVLDYRLPKS